MLASSTTVLTHKSGKYGIWRINPQQSVLEGGAKPVTRLRCAIENTRIRTVSVVATQLVLTISMVQGSVIGMLNQGGAYAKSGRLGDATRVPITVVCSIAKMTPQHQHRHVCGVSMRASAAK